MKRNMQRTLSRETYYPRERTIPAYIHTKKVTKLHSRHSRYSFQWVTHV